MTIITQKGGNYWVESFDLARTAITTGNSLITAHTLDRPGIFLAISICLDNSASVADRQELSASVRNINNNQLSLGDFVTGIESLITNNAGGTVTTGAHLVVWMKKRGVPT